MSVIDELRNHFSSGQSGIVLTSAEPEECLSELALYAGATQGAEEEWELQFWDAADGLTDQQGAMVSLRGGTNDEDDDSSGLKALGLENSVTQQKVGLYDTLENALQTSRTRQCREEVNKVQPEDSTLKILVIRNLDRHLCPGGSHAGVDAGLLIYIQKLVNIGQGTKSFVIMQTAPGFKLPAELVELCEFVEHKAPDSEERKALIESLEVNKDDISVAVLEATAGLSRGKVAQYAAETISQHGRLVPKVLWNMKAKHLAISSGINLWSSDFSETVPLSPVPKLSQFHDTRQMQLLVMQDFHTNRQLAEKEVRVRISYSTTTGEEKIEWLDPMPRTKFESDFRPNHNVFGFDSVVGLKSLKDLVVNGLRPELNPRARARNVILIGPPGTGKTTMSKAISSQLKLIMATIKMGALFDKYVGETDKNFARIVETLERLGRGTMLFLDEIQRTMPSGSNSENSTDNRMAGNFLTWLSSQKSNFILAAANDISHLPPEMTRSGRFQKIFVGYPGKEAKDAAWKMYIAMHELSEQEIPKDEMWTPADIAECCLMAEQQGESLMRASRWITPSYESQQKEMDKMMDQAASDGLIDADTGEIFVHPRKRIAAGTVGKKIVRRIKTKTVDPNGEDYVE